MSNYNHYKDTYFKQQGSSGAISNGSSTYSLRNDGNTYLNGNLDVTTINSVALTNLPNLPYLDTTSSITSQLASKQAVLSNASFLDVTSSAQTQINTINTTLNGKTTLVIVQSNNNLFSGNNAFSGTNTFNSYLPTSTLTPSTSTQLITKAYGDASYTAIGGTTLSAVQSNNNTWTGTNIFNTSLPTSTLTPSTSTQLITKAYGDASYTAIGGTTLSAVQSNNNTWTGTNIFNTSLPTSTLTPSTSSQLTTKTYVDTQLATKQNTLSNSSYLDVTSSAQTQINNLNTILTGATWNSTYSYLNLSNNLHVYGTLQLAGLSNDVSTTFSNIYSTLSTLTTLSAIQSNNNAWTGTNTFNTSLPTSTLTPSSSTQLITKAYADANYTASGGTTLSAIQSNNNAWTGTNTFNTSLPTSTLTPSSSTQLITKAYADANYTASGGTTLSAIQSNNNAWTGTNTFNTSLPTSTLTPSTSTQLITKAYADTQIATKQPTLTSSSVILCSTINGNSLTNLPNLQYLDISSSLTTQLSGKQPTLTSSSVISCSTINGNSLTNLPNLQYLDISSSLTTQLANLQPTITSTTNLSFGSLTLNTVSSTTPLIQFYGYGGSGSSVAINLDTYYGRSGGPASIIKAIDNGSNSNDIVFYTATSGSASTTTSERMRIYASGAINMNNTLNCNSLNVQKGSIYSDNSSMWLYNSTNTYNTNFALWQGSSGNTVLNSSSGQDMEFKIGNTMYMQMYQNGVVNIGANQVFNKQLALYDTNTSDTASSATAFYGFGVNSHVLRYQVDSTSSGHKFYGGTTNYATIDNTGVTVNNGVVTSNNVTAPASNNLTLNAPSGQTINFAFANTNYCSISQSYLTIPSIVCNTNLNCNGTFNLIPAGTIYMSVISSMSGYLLCDGTSYSTTTYANLYSAISYNFGGSGSSFKVPDFRGAFLRGYGTNGTYTNYTGTSLGSAQTDTVGSHSHTISPPNANYCYGNNSGSYGDVTGTKTVETTSNYGVFPTSTGSSGSTETKPFNYSVNYFIKF